MTRKSISFDSITHRYYLELNETHSPIAVVNNQYICRDFHQACQHKVQVDASTKFSWAHRKPVIHHTIHKPEMKQKSDGTLTAQRKYAVLDLHDRIFWESLIIWNTTIKPFYSPSIDLDERQFRHLPCFKEFQDTFAVRFLGNMKVFHRHFFLVYLRHFF